MRRNYQQKLLQEIITRNYELVYCVAENLGIIGILAFSKELKKGETLEVSYNSPALSNHRQKDAGFSSIFD